MPLCCPLCQRETVHAAETESLLRCADCDVVYLREELDAGPVFPVGLASIYRLHRVIGNGAFGTVVLGNRIQDGRQVAIKFLHQSVGPDGLARFLQEIEVFERLDHPAILKARAGEPGGYPHLVMEYMPGGSLKERLKTGGRLDAGSTLAIARSCLAGLAALHRAGIVHRDIKPGNILFARDGSARIADLGIAKCLESIEKLTKTGVVVGTPAYMAPEQLAGLPATPSSDLYALALVMVECLTGVRPFPASNPVRLLEQMRGAERLLPGDRSPLAAAVRRALAFEPADRFPGAEAFLEALVVPVSPRSRWSVRGVAALFAILLFLLGRAACLWMARRPPLRAALAWGRTAAALGADVSEEWHVAVAAALATDDPAALSELRTGLPGEPAPLRRWRLVQLAELLDRRRDPGAERALRDALQVDDSWSEGRVKLVDLLRRESRFAEARYPALRARRDGYRLDYILRCLIHIESQLGHSKEAEEAARAAVRLTPGCSYSHQELAQVLWERGAREEALASYRNAEPFLAGKVELGLEAGARFLEAGRVEEAERFFWRGLGLPVPAEGPSAAAAGMRGALPEADAGLRHRLAVFAVWLGEALQERRALGRAEACLRYALRLLPGDRRALDRLASLLFATGRDAEAVLILDAGARVRERR